MQNIGGSCTIWKNLVWLFGLTLAVLHRVSLKGRESCRNSPHPKSRCAVCDFLLCQCLLFRYWQSVLLILRLVNAIIDDWIQGISMASLCEIKIRHIYHRSIRIIGWYWQWPIAKLLVIFLGCWSCSMWCQINTCAISVSIWGRSDSRQAPSKNFSYRFSVVPDPSLKLRVFRVGPRGRNRGNHTTKLRHLWLWLSLRLRRHLHHHAKPWHEPWQKSTKPLCSPEVSSRLLGLSRQESVECWSSSSINCWYCATLSRMVHSGTLLRYKIMRISWCKRYPFNWHEHHSWSPKTWNIRYPFTPLTFNMKTPKMDPWKWKFGNSFWKPMILWSSMWNFELCIPSLQTVVSSRPTTTVFSSRPSSL